MKRKVVWGLLVVAAIAAVTLLIVIKNNSDKIKGDDITTGQKADAGGTKKACDVFTLDMVKQNVGENAKPSEVGASGQASTKDVSVTSCIYEVSKGSDVVIANALLRGAKNKNAYQSNTYGFNGTREHSTEPGEKAASEKIPGLGDDAYYNPTTNQVNVLVNGGQYWLIIQVTNNRAAATQIAHSIVSKL